MEGIELLPNEQFKQIIGYENYYISNCGRCWNNKTKRFSGSISKKTGYVQVGLSNEGKQKQHFLIHRLVLQYFGEPQPEGMNEVDHKNHQRDDNRIQNLRWCNSSENNKNKTGTRGHKFVFLDELPETARSLDSYNNHGLDDVYIDYETQKLYLFNGVKYRELVPSLHGINTYYWIRDNKNNEVLLYHKVLFP